MTDKKQASDTAKTVREQDAATEPEPDANETVPGGRYIVNGQTVDANGKPVKG